MRFDLTVPLARYFSSHRGELPGIFKRYQIGPVWRAERAQHGRFREFIQCDVDVLGSASMMVEADVILATSTALAELGFSDLDGPVNSRPLLRALVASFGVPSELLAAAVVGIDKLDKEAPACHPAELTSKGISDAAAAGCWPCGKRPRLVVARSSGRHRRPGHRPRVADAPGRAATDPAARGAGADPAVARGPLVFDPFLARGMDYYTGPIFEVAAAGCALQSGGRWPLR